MNRFSTRLAQSVWLFFIIADAASAADPQSLIRAPGNTNAAAEQTARYQVGTCVLVLKYDEEPQRASVYPGSVANSYVFRQEGVDVAFDEKHAAKVEVLSAPLHGIYSAVEGDHYAPDKGFIGSDYIFFRVSQDDFTVLVHVYIHVVEYMSRDWYSEECTEAPENSDGIWKVL